MGKCWETVGNWGFGTKIPGGRPPNFSGKKNPFNGRIKVSFKMKIAQRLMPFSWK